SVYQFASESADVPTQISHTKDRNLGRLVPEFRVMVEDVEIDGDPRGGLRVVHQGDVSGMLPSQSKSSPEERILSFLRESGGRFNGTKEELQKAVHMKAKTFLAAVAGMLEAGSLIERGRDWSLPSFPSLVEEGRKAVLE